MAKKAEASGNSALDSVLAQIRKEFGEGAIMKLGEVEQQKGIQVISTGSFDRRIPACPLSGPSGC